MACISDSVPWHNMLKMLIVWFLIQIWFSILETENMTISMVPWFYLTRISRWRTFLFFFFFDREIVDECVSHSRVRSSTHLWTLNVKCKQWHTLPIRIENSFEFFENIENTWNATFKSPINPDNRHSLPAQFEICLLCLLFSLHLICSWIFFIKYSNCSPPCLSGCRIPTNIVHQLPPGKKLFLIDLLSDLWTSMQFINIACVRWCTSTVWWTN